MPATTAPACLPRRACPLMPHTSPTTSSLLRGQHGGFLAFLLARVFAVGATQIQAVVVAWQVYDLTRSPMALAYVGLAQFIPMLLLLLPFLLVAALQALGAALLRRPLM